MQPLSRLFRPKSLAVIGGGAWGEAVLLQAQKFGYQGTLYAIHPSKPEIAGVKAYTGAHVLPEPPDATFIGINREATVGAVERLRKKGSGGAVFCLRFCRSHGRGCNRRRRARTPAACRGRYADTRPELLRLYQRI